MPNTHPWQLTISDAASLLQQRELSPVELVASCLQRIDAVEDRVRAWAFVDREGALAAARHAEDELGRHESKGLLHGIPIGVKDIFFTDGIPTEAGSRSMAGFVPDYDATSIRKLKDAGAIVLGKTHTTEFALFDPAPTRNPGTLDHTPGGSSSGSGAAVASGMCPAALGSQTAGSVLRPAAYNGVVGLKPHHGRVSAYGVIPVSWTLDHVGVLARSVEDTAIVLHAMAGYDPKDRYAIDAPVPDYAAAVKGAVRPPHVGLVRDYFFELASEEMRQHTESIAQRLREAGAVVEEVAMPASFARIRETLSPILHAECAAYHQDRFRRDPEGFGTFIAAAIQRGLDMTAVDYVTALQSRHTQIQEMMPIAGGFDALLTPGATGPSPQDLATTGDPAMQLPWSVLGFPSLSLPTGLSRDDMPLAIQLAGAPDGEEALLRAARWCEATLQVTLEPSL